MTIAHFKVFCSTEMVSTSKLIGIIVMMVFSFPGIFLLWVSSHSIKPVLFKVKELTFVPVQGTITKVTIYESKSSEKRGSSSYPGTRSGVEAYFIRLKVSFTFESNTYSVDAKKYTGQYETFSEAYSVAENLAPGMPIAFEYYYKKKITMPDQIEFLKKFIQQYSSDSAPVTFKINPQNPLETSLDDPYIINKLAILLITFVFFLIPMTFGWYCISHFGKANGFANTFLFSTIIIDCLLAFIINLTSPQTDYLAKPPKISFILDSKYTYDQIKRFIEEN